MKPKNLFLRGLYLWLICVSAYVNNTYAQTPSGLQLKGKLSANSPENFDDVSVYLLKGADKSLVKMEQADSTGQFLFESLLPGNYLILVQSYRFKSYESASIDLKQSLVLPVITLEPLSQQLKEVTISHEKPLIQQSFDKTTVNVANSITSVGSNALEVLAKSPGVQVDPNDNLAMRGRQGVMVMVDGKALQLQGADLSNYLKSLQASQIEKIDLITNPSARYDAAGNAGIIDIRLKKSTFIGTNGTLTLSGGFGKYDKFNPNFSLNHKRPGANYFMSYNFNRNRTFSDLALSRDFFQNDAQFLGSNVYDNYFKNRHHVHNLRFGADFNLSEKSVLGFVANGIYTRIKARSSSLAETYDADLNSTGAFQTYGSNNPDRKQNSLNVNFRHKFNTSGSELAVDADYAVFTMDEVQNYTTNYQNAQGQESQNPYLLRGVLGGDLQIKSVKADYSSPIKAWNAQLDMGWKSSWVTTDNEVNFYDRSNGGAVLDTGKSNHFIYKENINALYVNANKKWANWQVQMGLRLENTIANGLQKIKNEAFDRNYYQLFPSAYVGYSFNENNQFGFSASRRINRPSYKQLNPFKAFLDPLTYATGNPYLLPELSEVLELSYTWKQQYLFKVGYTHTSDNILTILTPDVQPRSIMQTHWNLADYHFFNASVSFPIKWTKWWNSHQDVVSYYGKYQGDIGQNNLNLARVSYQISSLHHLKLKNGFSAEVVANYQSSGYYGPLDYKGIFVMNMGLQKLLMQNKASLKLNFTDVWRSNQVNAKTVLYGYNEYFLQYRDAQVFTLSFNYKFGQSTGSANRRVGAAEEEKRRAN